MQVRYFYASKASTFVLGKEVTSSGKEVTSSGAQREADGERQDHTPLPPAGRLRMLCGIRVWAGSTHQAHMFPAMCQRLTAQQSSGAESTARGTH